MSPISRWTHGPESSEKKGTIKYFANTVESAAAALNQVSIHSHYPGLTSIIIQKQNRNEIKPGGFG